MSYSEVFNDSYSKSYFNSLSDHHLLSVEDEIELSKRSRSGDRKAAEKLVVSNLRLVVKIAKGFSSADISFIDLVQEGNIGLIHSVEKFNPDMGCRFSTYASYWIKHYISRYIAKSGRLIRLPIRKNDIMKKIHQEREEYINAFGVEPSVQDISLAIGIDEKTVKDVLCYMQPSVSLEYPMLNDESSLHEIIGDSKGLSPDAVFLRQELKDEMNSALGSLMDNEKEILEMRFGFSGDGECTLKEAGQYFGVSAETVRQIELRAIGKIKQRYQHLECYID